MVLSPKRWKSRSSPGFMASGQVEPIHMFTLRPPELHAKAAAVVGDAGWSSPVARQAHNLKVVGSNPTPATTKRPASAGLFVVLGSRLNLAGTTLPIEPSGSPRPRPA